LSTVSFFSFIKRPLGGEDPGQYLLQTCSSLRSGPGRRLLVINLMSSTLDHRDRDHR
jgi:hypothetical protein